MQQTRWRTLIRIPQMHQTSLSIYIYIFIYLPGKNASLPPSHLLNAPLPLLYTLLSSVSSSSLHPLPSFWQLQPWWFTLWITNRYLKVSAHISFSLPPSLSFSLALLLPLYCSFPVLVFFLFSKFQSAAGRICFFSTSESKRSQNIRGNVKQPLSTSCFFSPLHIYFILCLLVVNHLHFSQEEPIIIS